jgi:hypothetical protein
MSTKYWDIYVLYIKRCEKENYINDIDPNHYLMEWNHFWPQSIFGDWPVGQWLTKKQHAIASALQTLVFKENCMCGWHKSYLPPKLLELSWPFFCEAASINGRKGIAVTHAEKDENGKSINAVKAGINRAAATNAIKDEFGRSVNAVKGALVLNSEKDELGRSVNAVKGAIVLNSKKDETGKSVNASKGGLASTREKNENGKSIKAIARGKAAHKEKNEEGKSLHAIRTLGAVHKEKDENGKSLHALKLHANKDENGFSIFALENGGVPRKSIVVTFPDFTQKKFKSISEAARALKTKRGTIVRHLGVGPVTGKASKWLNHRFDLAE